MSEQKLEVIDFEGEASFDNIKAEKHERKIYDRDMNDDMDGRKPFEWKSGYPSECINEMRVEAVYLFTLLLVGFIIYVLNYVGILTAIVDLPSEDVIKFSNLMFCIAGGLLGGTTFGIKFFYRVVARGQWHKDRKYWRFFTPWVSISVALAMSAIFNDNMDVIIMPVYFLTGYLSGYFSDHAVSKMYEVASALFSYPAKK